MGIFKDLFTNNRAENTLYKQECDTLERKIANLKKHIEKLEEEKALTLLRVIAAKEILIDTKQSDLDNMVETYNLLQDIILQNNTKPT